MHRQRAVPAERQRPGPFCPDPLAGPPPLAGSPSSVEAPGPPLPLVFHARLALLRALAHAAPPPRSPSSTQLFPPPSSLCSDAPLLERRGGGWWEGWGGDVDVGGIRQVTRDKCKERTSRQRDRLVQRPHAESDIVGVAAGGTREQQPTQEGRRVLGCGGWFPRATEGMSSSSGHTELQPTACTLALSSCSAVLVQAPAARQRDGTGRWLPRHPTL